ncbi:hypothetical protein AGMMS50212_06780 [Spirochaetia bacterium]|nr:hypothetical protein AGMMS50212_06780 [Spirochaetia bacterium]
MITIEQTVAVPENRHVNFDVTLPDTFPTGQVRVAVNFMPENGASKSDPVLEKVLEEGKKIWTYNDTHPEEVSKAVNAIRGCLKGSNAFGGLDGVMYQRQIRDEWEDRLVKMGLSNNAD